MAKIFKILILGLVFTGAMKITFADRGVGKKKSNKIAIDLPASKTSSGKMSFNLTAGVKYKGSFAVSAKGAAPSGSNTLVTYQKGSNVYIIPYKQKVLVPEVKQGYTGLKLIIKRN